MSIFIIIFLIIFYLNLRFLIVISWYTPPSEKQRPSVTTQWLWLLPLLSLLVLGFLIMEGYYFLPLIIIFLFDPVKLVSPKLYYTRVKQWSVKVVANNFHSALWYYIISTVFLWINYYYNFYEKLLNQRCDKKVFA